MGKERKSRHQKFVLLPLHLSEPPATDILKPNAVFLVEKPQIPCSSDSHRGSEGAHSRKALQMMRWRMMTKSMLLYPTARIWQSHEPKQYFASTSWHACVMLKTQCMESLCKYDSMREGMFFSDECKFFSTRSMHAGYMNYRMGTPLYLIWLLLERS